MNLNIYRSRAVTVIMLCCIFITKVNMLSAQEPAKEEDYFRIMRVSAPEGNILEVGGLCTLPDGNLAVTTRRGDIYIVENPTSPRPWFRKFASGLHEVLGVAYKDGALYVVQRGELTKITDENKDGKADNFETVYAWPLSGNYHEYSFGPKIAPDGSFFVTLNLGFPDAWWHPKSMVPWRGWALKIKEDGSMEPWAAGLRSPCGISMIDGELYYTDNQGDWVAAGSIMPLKKGSFAGHPASLVWDTAWNSPVHTKQDQIFSKISQREEFDNDGRPVKPQNIVNEKFTTIAEMRASVPELQQPAVWLPHGILGISSSEIVKIPEGVFGPFAGQLLSADQGQSNINRIFLEKVNGELQGAAWMFRSGFQSGVVRLAWAKDGSLFAGETNRGWGSAGDANQGLQRLVWNNKIPFEMRTVKAMPDGFEIEFTKPVDLKLARDPSSYSVESFTYKYHAVYGSPDVNKKAHVISGLRVSADGMRVRMVVSNLRKNYIHTIKMDGIRDQENAYSLVHPTVYYTLNNIPEGAKLAAADMNTLRPSSPAKAGSAAGSSGSAKPGSNEAGTSVPAKKGSSATPASVPSKAAAKDSKASNTAKPSLAAIKPLLDKYTCSSCHNTTKKQVGPSFSAISARNYSTDKMIDLIYNPKPSNWPDYAVAMPPMSQVPKEDAQKIVSWIKSLTAKKE